MLDLCSGDNGGNNVNPFESECAPTDASCGQLTVRWTVDRFGRDSTCAEVDGAKVELTATFDGDNRVATFAKDCGSQVVLTTKLPLGPYSLEAVLLDAAGVELDTQTGDVTLGVAGTVTE